MSEFSRIDQAAVELLQFSRRAVRQEVNDRARAIHEQSLEADKTLTVIGELGAQALGLCQELDAREAYFMDKCSKLSFTHNRRVERYAGYIVQSRDGDISKKEARRWAEDQISMTDYQRLWEKYDTSESSRIYILSESRTGYKQYSPPLLQTDSEFIDGVEYAQQWRVMMRDDSDEYDNENIDLREFRKRNIYRFLTTQHEFKYQNGRKVTPVHDIAITRKGEVESIIERSQNGNVPLQEDELFLPLGILYAAREAVRASVPYKVSKKW